MERLKQVDYRLKAKQYFFTNRPYGIRIDIRKPGYVLFNKNLNVLGNAQPSQLEHLPIELFESIDDIPMEGEVIEKKDGIIDIYFIAIIPSLICMRSLTCLYLNITISTCLVCLWFLTGNCNRAHSVMLRSINFPANSSISELIFWLTMRA